MKMHYWMLVIAGLATSVGALADSHFSGRAAAPANPTWKAECGSCHMAYPPSMLPAASWRAVMSGLDKHFGVDASLDAKTAAEIGAYLEKNAGRGRTSAVRPVLRITDTGWFQEEHDEIGAATWKNSKVKSPSNCAACHQGAEQGNFGEHSVRIPR